MSDDFQKRLKSVANQHAAKLKEQEEKMRERVHIEEHNKKVKELSTQRWSTVILPLIKSTINQTNEALKENRISLAINGKTLPVRDRIDKVMIGFMRNSEPAGPGIEINVDQLGLIEIIFFAKDKITYQKKQIDFVDQDFIEKMIADFLDRTV